MIKVRTIIGIAFGLITLVNMTGCDNKDNAGSYDVNQRQLLYGEWRLVGWNDGGNWFEIDTKYVGHQHLSIEIPENGIVKAYSSANEATLGEMMVNGNDLLFRGMRMITQVRCDIMESNFFEAHIFGVRSFQLSGNLLRLYYSDNDYFVFTCDF